MADSTDYNEPHPVDTEDQEEARALAERWKDLPPEPNDPELLALREQLFKRELAIIYKLKLMLDNGQYSASEISKVISEAIVLKASRDERLVTALEPMVEGIVTESMRLHRDEFVNALFPLMGPSIRKSIAENFRSMMGNFSKSLEMSLSWRGLRWRIEALRTGKPFSEVVMLHTLIYRVEQIFFIHSETGLVLSHLVNEGVGSQDADMVSAMLTAIQDFVRDCFAAGQQGELESLQMGEFTIIIEKSPRAYLACVVRGTPPADFRGNLRDALDQMLVEYSAQLATFNGDNAPFTHASRFLEGFMVSRYVDENKPLPKWARFTPAIAVLMLVAVLGIGRFLSWGHERDMQDALALLRAEPGIMVIYVDEKGSNGWQVVAFKDDLARVPEAVLESTGQRDNFSFRLVPFISYDPAIVERRVLRALNIPEGVSMKLAGNVLILEGNAPMDWIIRARELAYTLPGVTSVVTDELSDPRMNEILALVRQVESTKIEFPTGQAMPVKADLPKLEKVVETLVQLEKMAADMGLAVSLSIFGHADSTGAENTNYEISQARARTLAAMLYAKSSNIPVSLYGLSSQFAENKEPRPDQSSRRIDMRVQLLKAAQPHSASTIK